MEKIAIIHTGGTFVMEPDEFAKLTPGNYAFDYIERSIFPLFKDVKIIQLPLFNIDSSLFKPEHWLKLATQIENIYHQYDGFVVIHGTDTMTYTASALSFILINLQKPVVITGSQLPLKAKRSDAFSNLVDAIYIAARSDLKEVVVTFDHKVFRGNRVKKKDVWGFDAFYSPNFPPLIKIGVNIKEKKNLYLPLNKGSFHIDSKLNEKVLLIPVFPGFDFTTLLPIVKEKNTFGIVLEAYGSGNIPSNNLGLEELFIEASKNEIPIAVCSQSPLGKVNLELYQVASKANYYGLISAIDMTRESTIVKMMIASGRFDSLDEIRDYMKSNIAGEKEV